MVVLNFMGLVPASCPATAEVCDTVRVDVSSDDDEDMPQRSHSALPGGNCDLQPVPEVPGEENCSTVTRSFQNGAVGGHHYSELLDSRGADAAEIVVSTCDEDNNVYEPTSGAVSATQQISHPSRNSAYQMQSALLQTPVTSASSRTPSPCSAASPALIERQSSSRSTTSSRSRSSGTRNCSINVQLADLETLVRAHALPPLVIPLRDEISHEMEALGQERHDADASEGVSRAVNLYCETTLCRSRCFSAPVHIQSCYCKVYNGPRWPGNTKYIKYNEMESK